MASIRRTILRAISRDEDKTVDSRKYANRYSKRHYNDKQKLGKKSKWLDFTVLRTADKYNWATMVREKNTRFYEERG